MMASWRLHKRHMKAEQSPHEGHLWATCDTIDSGETHTQLTTTSQWPHVILTKVTWCPYRPQEKIWEFLQSWGGSWCMAATYVRLLSCSFPWACVYQAANVWPLWGTCGRLSLMSHMLAVSTCNHAISALHLYMASYGSYMPLTAQDRLTWLAKNKVSGTALTIVTGKRASNVYEEPNYFTQINENYPGIQRRGTQR